MSTYQKECREKDKDKFNAKKLGHLKRRRKAAQDLVVNYLSNKCCVDCGETDIVVLDFDHLKDKKFEIGLAVSNGLDVEKIKAEITKCVIRCANCHRRKTSKELGWFKSALKA